MCRFAVAFEHHGRKLVWLFWQCSWSPNHQRASAEIYKCSLTHKKQKRCFGSRKRQIVLQIEKKKRLIQTLHNNETLVLSIITLILQFLNIHASLRKRNQVTLCRFFQRHKLVPRQIKVKLCRLFSIDHVHLLERRHFCHLLNGFRERVKIRSEQQPRWKELERRRRE